MHAWDFREALNPQTRPHLRIAGSRKPVARHSRGVFLPLRPLLYPLPIIRNLPSGKDLALWELLRGEEFRAQA